MIRRAKKRKQYNKCKQREERKQYINSKGPVDATEIKKKPSKNLEILHFGPKRIQIGEVWWTFSGIREWNWRPRIPYHKNKKGVHDRAIQREIRDFILTQRNPFMD